MNNWCSRISKIRHESKYFNVHRVFSNLFLIDKQAKHFCKLFNQNYIINDIITNYFVVKFIIYIVNNQN